MSSINGYDNEYQFVKYFNNKTLQELDPLSYDLFKKIYPDMDLNDEIKCWRNHYKQKSDIFVKVNNKIKGISIKKGSRNSVHVEPISEFIHFLISNHISRDSVISYLKYQYADGTTNGTGKVRLSSSEYKKDNQKEIDNINREINQKDIILKAMDRFILKGNNSNFDIDAIIYGEVNDYLWISKEDIKKLFLYKLNEPSSSVHFGPLTVQPKNRCLNYNPLYNKDRYCVQLKWYSLFDDIIANMYLKNNNQSNY